MGEENGQAWYIGIKNKGREGAAHKSEWWRRTIATKDSILAGNGQRNNAESIEVGLATPLGFVVVVLSARRGSNASARLNSLYFLERRILKSSNLPYILPPTPASGSSTAGRVHSAGTVFFFSLLLPQCLPSFYFLKLGRLVAFNATRRKGARNYLRFIANIGFVAPLSGAACGGSDSLFLAFPSLSFRHDKW